MARFLNWRTGAYPQRGAALMKPSIRFPGLWCFGAARSAGRIHHEAHFAPAPETAGHLQSSQAAAGGARARKAWAKANTGRLGEPMAGAAIVASDGPAKKTTVVSAGQQLVANGQAE